MMLQFTLLESITLSNPSVQVSALVYEITIGMLKICKRDCHLFV